MDKLPVFSHQLIDLLNDLYPERCPDITSSERDIWWYAGQRELVRNLYTRLQQEKEEGGLNV